MTIEDFPFAYPDKPGRFWVALLFLISSLFAAKAQTITNVKASQQGREVHISYDISGASLSDKFIVQVFMGTNDGWQGPLNVVKGHVGPNVPGGCCKKITWLALDEYQAFSGSYQFKVVAEPLKPKRQEQQPPHPQTNTVIEPDLAFVEGGTFTMGSKKDAPDAGDDEKPRHEVQVSSFYMSKFELTYGEFKTFVNETGYQTEADKDGGSYVWNATESKWDKKTGVNWKYDAQGQPRDIDEKRHPVIHVSWNDAQAYIKWLNGKTGKNYRLPTEAEWEYAAKGGQKSQGYVYSGSNDINAVAWYSQNSGNRTHTVGEKQANELGLYDMTGNVWEWCQDWYDPSFYAGRPDLDINPSGGSPAQYRVFRGGSWLSTPASCRVAFRSWNAPGNRFNSLGFRLVLPSW